ncbi:MAG: DUF4331 family protein [Polyangiaceae bacterium]
MRTWMKWVGVTAFGLLATTAIAADHTDGSTMANGTDANPDADITDVYAWVKNDNQTVVLIMNIVGGFSDNVHYAFHVARQADQGAAIVAAGSAEDVICEFDAAGEIQCWVGDQGYVKGDASSNSGITSDDGNIRVHAGQHADPFYFNLTGFGTAIATATAAAGALTFNTAGCATNLLAPATAVGSTCPGTVTIAGLLRGLLDGTYADANCAAGPGAEANDFATLNVNSLVLEIDQSLLAGTGDYLQVWASTHAKAGS